MAYDRLLQEVLAAEPRCALQGDGARHEDLVRDVRAAHESWTNSKNLLDYTAKCAIGGFGFASIFCGATGVAALVQAFRPGGLGAMIDSLGTGDISGKVAPTLAAAALGFMTYGIKNAHGLYLMRNEPDRLNTQLEHALRALSDFEQPR